MEHEVHPQSGCTRKQRCKNKRIAKRTVKRWLPHTQARIEREDSSDQHDRSAKDMPYDWDRVRAVMLCRRNLIALYFWFNAIFRRLVHRTKIYFRWREC